MNDLVDELLAERGITAPTPEDRARLQERMDYFVRERLVAAMTEDDAASLHDYLDRSPSPERVQKYIADHVDDIDGLTAAALAEFRERYLAEG